MTAIVVTQKRSESACAAFLMTEGRHFGAKRNVRGEARGAEELLRWLDLWNNTNEFIEGFSRGMRQKLALAGALIHDPQLLILDEPLTGLDAAAARLVKDLLLERVKQGNTVVLTTHILEMAERLAERISIIQKGKIIAQGSLDELRTLAQASASGRPGATLEDVFLELTAPSANGT